MATGDQSGTWGDTTNTNLGTLLEQAITGYLAIAKVGTGDYTLSNTDYLSNETRNALIEFTGTPGGAFNVVVPLAEKLWVFKNSTNGAMTVKGATGTTITVAVGTSRWLYCDGTNVLDALTGTLATQAASSVAITGGTVTGLTNLTLASGAATPATNNAAALGTSSLQWADLFLASGGVINFDNGDVTITEGTDTLAFAGAASGYTFSHVVTPAANDGAALGTGAVSWSDLFLASGGVINFNNGNYTLTHSAGVLTANGALSIGTGNVLTAGTIELGAATDTTISRGAAGFIAVEGNRVPSPASQASGDLLYRGATEWERLAKGTAAQVLTMNAGATAPEWATPAGGGITTVAVQVITSTGTYTPTSGMVYCIAEVVGGGAGGQSVTEDTVEGAGGGGAGGYARKLLTAADIGASKAVTIGAGGAANSAGGTTSLGAIMSATGGAAGSSDTLNGTAAGTGTGGDINVPGQPGGASPVGDAQLGANGGSSFYGAGGKASSADGVGAVGTGYGAGGAGGYASGTTNRNGGAGSAGVVVITEFIA
jgi:hypothetical protein